jgi:predicted nucleic acid-binding Zn ribbon protein
MKSCFVCGKPRESLRSTCSEDCDEKFVLELEQTFGKEKKVISERTGKTHLVPTLYIVENGLNEFELCRFPQLPSN